MPHKVWALVSFFLPIKIQIFIMHQLLCDALSREKTLVIYILLKEKRCLSEGKSAWSFGKFIFNENWGFTGFENYQKSLYLIQHLKISHTNGKNMISGKVKIETFLLIFKDCEGGITRYIHAWKMTPSNGPDPRLKTDSPPVLLSLTGVKWFKIPPQDRVFKLCNICQLVEAEKFDNDNLWIPW